MDYKIILLCVACFVAGRFGIPAYKYVVAHVQGNEVAPVPGNDNGNGGTKGNTDKPADPKDVAGKTVVNVNERPTTPVPENTPVTTETTITKEKTVETKQEKPSDTSEATTTEAPKKFLDLAKNPTDNPMLESLKRLERQK